MNLLQAFNKARPGATFGDDGPNGFSLELLNERYDGQDKVTQSELDTAWLLCVEDDMLNDIIQQLSNTDKGIIRVIEDLITILIQKGNLSLSDFSQPVQDKILARKALRDQLSGG